MFTPSHHSVLKAVAEKGRISRSEIAVRTGLSKAAISVLSRDLIEEGILEECAATAGGARQGRPSIMLTLNPSYAYFIGASIVEDPALMVLADLHGNVVAQCTATWSNDPQEIAATIAGSAETLSREAGVGRALGVGVALSGLVNNSQDRCLHSANLGWHNVPVAEIITKATGIATYLENDANAVAVGEKLYGLARQARSFSVITFGDGIGCAHYLDDALYRGHAGGAGEIAHCTIEPGGLPCRCGKRGCLDTIASRHAIIDQARGHHLDVQSPEELEVLAASGNSDAIAVLHRAGGALGLAIAHVIQVNNPEMVLIVDVEGGLGSLMRTVAQQAIEGNVLPRLSASTTISFHRASQDLWARGAASIAAHKFLTGGPAH